MPMNFSDKVSDRKNALVRLRMSKFILTFCSLKGITLVKILKRYQQSNVRIIYLINQNVVLI